MKIISCSINDIEDIYRIDKEIYSEGCYPRFVIRQFFDCFGDNIKIAVDNHKTIGFSINGIANNSNEGWILSIGVSEKYRKSGVGTKLLSESINEFIKKGVEIVKLTVHPENSAIKIYEKSGFKREKNYDDYYGNKQNRVLMILNL